MPARLRRPGFWIALACLLPLLRLVGLGAGGGLGANPIEFVTHSTGTWTLVGLLVTLSFTPLRRLTGVTALIRYRRMLGLFSFFYACLHVLAYLWLDQAFDLAAIARDVVKRPFITAGFGAFLLLVPLAATSNHAMMRRLGRRWQSLHRLIYAAVSLGVLHYLWLVKQDITAPLIYGGVLVLLLVLRLPWGGALLRAAHDRFVAARR